MEHSKVVALVCATIIASSAAASAATNRPAFVTNLRGSPSAPSAVSTVRRRIPPYFSVQSTLLQSQFDNDDDDIYLLSLDGSLASTSRSRSWIAIYAALKVWPTELQSTLMELGMDPTAFDICNNDDAEDESYEWLLQKLSALSSITQQGNNPEAMLGCDSVLLTRLLLEEQLLDGGRSNGRGGKYGGKFHPSGERMKSNNVGSRPLTVGELYANWPDLRETTRSKYPFIEESSDGKVKRKDPLPVIQQCLTEIFSMKDGSTGMGSRFLPSWQSLAYDMLFDYQSSTSSDAISLRKNTILLLGHDAQLPWALKSLSMLGCSVDVESNVDTVFNGLSVNDDSSTERSIKVIVTTSEKALEKLTQGNNEGNATEPSLVVVIPDNQSQECHAGMIETIVTDKEIDRHVNVMHSSLEVLKQCKAFLGDDV